jgi:OFA family oxalate/formate antiporter-like MFS transporter
MMGTATGCIIAPGLGCVGGWFDKHRMLGMGLAYTGAGAGSAVIPFVTSAVYHYYGETDWRTTMQWTSLFACGIVIASIPILPRTFEHDMLRSAELRMGTYTRKVLISKSFIIMWVIALCNGYGFFAALYYFIPYATAQGHKDYKPYDKISISSATFLMTLFGIAQIVGNLIIGPVCKKLGNKTTYILNIFAGGITLGSMPFFHTYLALCVIASAYGFFSACMLTCMPGVCADHFAGPRLATAIGVLYTGFGLGGLLGPTITQEIVLARNGAFDVGIVSCGGVMIVGALIVVTVLPHPSEKISGEETYFAIAGSDEGFN